MYRTHTCGELRVENIGTKVTLSGWLQKNRDLGGMTFIDLRDRYGITQIAFNMETNAELCTQARKLGREFVIQVTGEVAERYSKNKKIPTGEIEIIATDLKVLSKSEVPPFTIEDQTDGGEDILMKYRYLDLRRNPRQQALMLRHKMSIAVRNYLDKQGFIDVETPVLIKSTPEGARDFVVPSRMNEGNFYALPQSPQVFKQLLMVAGYDRYYQIVKCFRDEDLRADRQPEFTQIDCEMAFVEQEDILNTFEGMAKHIFKMFKNVDFNEPFKRMPFSEAMAKYGSDKPDLRFGMEINNLTEISKGKNFKIFDDAEYIGGICAVNVVDKFSRKAIDKLTDFVKKPQIGAQGLVWIKYDADGTFKSSIDKFFGAEDLQQIAQKFDAKPNDIIFLISGNYDKSLKILGDLRLELAKELNLIDNNKFAPLWVVDFPLVEWNEETNRFHAMHHPFTSPKPQDISMLETEPAKVRANAYDFVVNGVELGGGSIRIHDSEVQRKMFDTLGFTPEEAQNQFGFLMNAFKYGAPPHGGIAYGLDRWVAMFNNSESIKDVIAFPKNNSGKDVMIDSPSPVSKEQLDELKLLIKKD
ncbi:MAG: aspartate--tRNA ligase [Bacteroidales bacterium]|nr:aspartate--tRNA ligase [Bacteroidales bacterium]